MKNIAILIDFTEGSKLALQQAYQLASKMNAILHGVNIVTAKDLVAQTELDLIDFFKSTIENGTNFKTAVEVGSLFADIPHVLKKLDPDLVVVCTHGVKGMFQHLFGAHILKLVQAIPYPSIVLQENNKTDLIDIKNILFPLGSHPNFKTKINQTVIFAKEFDAEVILYELDRPGLEDKNLLEKNLLDSKSAFTEHNIKHTRILDDLNVISAGYSRQTLEYAKENDVSIISLMSTISKNDVLFGVGDKENFLVNSYGIPILCCCE
jgi:nucleotide-binding universal stress UspA family protein